MRATSIIQCQGNLNLKSSFKGINRMSILHSKHSLNLEEIIFISKGQVRYIQTLTGQVEAPSFETSKFSLYFCICQAGILLSQTCR